MLLQHVARRGSALLCLVLVSPAVAAPPDVHGKLDRSDEFRVLRVWGSPEEMGYAHGYLLGTEFVELLNSMVAATPPEERARYDQQQAALCASLVLPERFLTEVKAMLRGITEAAGGTPTLEALNRPLKLEDLILHQAADALRAFGCSGFTVWGKQAGDAGVITTRNFDYLSNRGMVEQQLLLVRQPAGRHQVALVTYPALLIAFTGINDAGVCAFAHDGTGSRHTRPQGRYTPALLAMTDVLERSGPDNAHANAARALEGCVPYPFSYMVRVIAPRSPGQDGSPVRVFRIDAAGLSENPVAPGYCVTTNHYLTPDRQPVDAAGNWSLHRYDVLEARLDSTQTPRAAWELMGQVADHWRTPTLHSLIVYPERRRIDLGYARWENERTVAATERPPITITFDRLFAPPR